MTYVPFAWTTGELATASRANHWETQYNEAVTDILTLRRQLRETFRGLTLRTHPDADKAASQVFLNHADEIVMHDGTSVLDWDNLTADITASGANGLDTGSEGASRWYSIHAIRKSSDDTRGLLLHRAKSYDKDQALETGNDNTTHIRSSASTSAQGQTFEAGLTGPLPFADVHIFKDGSPTGQVWVEIYATSAGVPTGAALATSDKLDVALLATSAQWIRFVFRSSATVTAGITYALVLQGNFAITGSNYVRWTIDGSSPPYASGSMVTFNGTSWAANTAVDTYFRVYVTQNDTALTMPSGYDQHALVGWVYNNSSSNFDSFDAVDNFVTYPRVQNNIVVTGLTSTIPTLVDVGAILPPVPVYVTKIASYNTTAQARVRWEPDITVNAYNGALWQSAFDNDFSDGVAMFRVSSQFLYMSVTLGEGHAYVRAYKW